MFGRLDFIHYLYCGNLKIKLKNMKNSKSIPAKVFKAAKKLCPEVRVKVIAALEKNWKKWNKHFDDSGLTGITYLGICGFNREHFGQEIEGVIITGFAGRKGTRIEFYDLEQEEFYVANTKNYGMCLFM